MRHARAASTIVEIGVAEGASAAGLREAMPPDGTPLSHRPLPSLKNSRAQLPQNAPPGVLLLSRFREYSLVSNPSARKPFTIGKPPIDFLLIDGDPPRRSSQNAIGLDWSRFVKDDGVVAFHDARLFSPQVGPLQIMDRCDSSTTRSAKVQITPHGPIIEEVDSLVFVSRRKRS